MTAITITLDDTQVQTLLVALRAASLHAKDWAPWVNEVSAP